MQMYRKSVGGRFARVFTANQMQNDLEINYSVLFIIFLIKKSGLRKVRPDRTGLNRTFWQPWSRVTANCLYNATAHSPECLLAGGREKV